MNSEIRQFEEALIDICNGFNSIPIEAKLLALQLTTLKVQNMADEAIMNELKEATNAEGIC